MEWKPISGRTFSVNMFGQYRCDICGSTSSELDFIYNHTCRRMRNKMLPKLEDKFIISKAKTLKLKPKVAQQLGPLVEYVQEYLWSQDEYNRIEFKYDRTYVVVAKLKDEE